MIGPMRICRRVDAVYGPFHMERFPYIVLVWAGPWFITLRHRRRYLFGR